MTILKKEFLDDTDRLEELIIKNQPARINGSNDKKTANFFNHKTKVALQKCDFIHFNSKEQISFMIFDIDKVSEKKAIEVFPTISDFWDYLSDKVGLEPTFITQTSNGYHFAFHLKNHIFTHQEKPYRYLMAIKSSIIKLIGCDINGSARNYGIWRNPLRHNHYFSDSYNYELKDFRDLIIPEQSIQKKFDRTITIRQVNSEYLRIGNRNNAIFYASMKWAKGKKNLTFDNIYHYALLLNTKCDIALNKEEISSISRSVYSYYCKNKIYISSETKERDINEGAMKFEKIKYLSEIEYLLEVKNRQSLSAQRTNKIVDLEQKKENMRVIQKKQSEYIQSINQNKVNEAIEILNNDNKKINISAISRICGLSRNTVRKYC